MVLVRNEKLCIVCGIDWLRLLAMNSMLELEDQDVAVVCCSLPQCRPGCS